LGRRNEVWLVAAAGVLFLALQGWFRRRRARLLKVHKFQIASVFDRADFWPAE
jgi:hypothetical protein